MVWIACGITAAISLPIGFFLGALYVCDAFANEITRRLDERDYL